ncbi:unnamed protein product [Gulo gulo]|uniref:Uncharacterized protein n=1 Tax=Gulo gulo TaxID=48420 RepID=A0A9X9Q7C0_GULGU|nr:unnamed protein product [Gulo gulo]
MYGASLRKIRKLKVSQPTQYTCSFYGKTRMKKWRPVTGVPWTYRTPSRATVKSAIRRLKELKDEERLHRLKYW